MRISLIHGEDSQKAYSRYRELVGGSKKKGFEIINISDIKNISGQSLFEDKVVFTLEKANKVKLADWKWLSKNAASYNSNLLIYYDGSAPATTTKNLPKAIKIEKFDLPKIVFSFLDNIYPGNSKRILSQLSDLVKNEPIELVFHLLSRHLRDLYWSKVGFETMDLPDWRILKLKKQSDKFETKDLKKFINELSEIDVKAKTSDEDLKSLLDILIVKRLE